MTEKTTTPAPTVILFRCINFQCRVDTFRGVWQAPLNGCPVCLTPGSLVAG